MSAGCWIMESSTRAKIITTVAIVAGIAAIPRVVRVNATRSATAPVPSTAVVLTVSPARRNTTDPTVPARAISHATGMAFVMTTVARVFACPRLLALPATCATRVNLELTVWDVMRVITGTGLRVSCVQVWKAVVMATSGASAGVLKVGRACLACVPCGGYLTMLFSPTVETSSVAGAAKRVTG